MKMNLKDCNQFVRVNTFFFVSNNKINNKHLKIDTLTKNHTIFTGYKIYHLHFFVLCYHYNNVYHLSAIIRNAAEKKGSS